jgi:Excalibur calcium-binding domain
MLKISSLLVLAALTAGFFVVTASVNAQQMYKCKVNGTVTYQQEPCPTGQVRKPPTVQELNAGEKKRREAAVAVAVEKPAAVQEKTAASSQSTQSSEKSTPTASNSPTLPAPSSSFSCDGRKYCSQMKSCAEAKYFLANCPGVKMDGDKDGTPCEKQWCSR